MSSTKRRTSDEIAKFKYRQLSSRDRLEWSGFRLIWSLARSIRNVVRLIRKCARSLSGGCGLLAAARWQLEACSSTEKRNGHIGPPISWREIRHAVPPGASLTDVRERVWGPHYRRIVRSAPLPSTTLSTPPRSAPLLSSTYTPPRSMWGQNGGPFAFLWNYRPLLWKSLPYELVINWYTPQSAFLLKTKTILLDYKLYFYTFEIGIQKLLLETEFWSVFKSRILRRLWWGRGPSTYVPTYLTVT